jgi:hypothetical protein
MDRPSKLRRLSGLKRSLPHVSHSALGALLKFAQDNPMPEFSNRNHVREARNLAVAQPTPFGSLLKELEVVDVHGRPMRIDIQCPFAFLHLACATKHFGRLMAATAARHPPRIDAPWHLIVYSDEVTPGNQLKSENRRQLQSIYYSFAEFGPAALCHEDYWLTFATLKCSVVNNIDGGMSAVTTAMLKHFPTMLPSTCTPPAFG